MTRVRLASARTFRSLRIRNYRLFFLGQLASLCGTWMQTVALSWLVLTLTHRAVDVGVVTALQFVPMLVAGPWGGVIADRFDKRRTLVTTQAAMAVWAAVLATLTLSGVIQVWMIYLLAFLTGCANLVDVPTRQAFVVEMVGPEEVANAVGLNSAIFNAARIVGPAVAGVLILTVGTGTCFLLNAVSFVAVIAGLVAMRPQELHGQEPVPRARGQIIEGLRYVWARPELRSPLLLMAVVGTLGFNFAVVIPVLAKQAFAGNAGTFGLMTSVMGVGSLVGALGTASRARPTGYLLLGSCLVFGATATMAAAAPTLSLELPVLAVVGASSIAFIATLNSTLQLRSSAAMRGRVMALYAMVFLGSTPIGGPLVGWISQHFGPRWGLGLGGVATLAGGLAFGGGVLYARRRLAIGEVVAPPANEPAAA